MLKEMILIFIGISAGMAISAGVFGFIVAIGLINRLMAATRTAKLALLYEDMITLGAIIGNIVYVFSLDTHLNIVGLSLYGLFFGLFDGALAVSLAETIKIMPVVEKRFSLGRAMPYIILMFALGKAVGSLYYMWSY